MKMGNFARGLYAFLALAALALGSAAFMASPEQLAGTPGKILAAGAALILGASLLPPLVLAARRLFAWRDRADALAVQLRDRDSEISALRRQASGWKAAQAWQQSRLEEKKAELKAANLKLADAENFLDLTSGKLDAAEGRAKAAEARAAELGACLEDLRRDFEDLRRELGRKDGELRGLEAELAAAAGRAKTAEAGLAQAQARLADAGLELQKARFNARAARQEAEAACQAELADCRAQVIKLAGDCETVRQGWRRVAARHDRLLARLPVLVAERDEARRQLAACRMA